MTEIRLHFSYARITDYIAAREYIRHRLTVAAVASRIFATYRTARI